VAAKKKGKKGPGLGSLLDPKKTASGKQLRRLAKALSKLETRPQAKAYGRLAKELKGQQAADTLGLRRLGAQTQRSIGQAANAFDVGAQGATGRQAAIGQMLQENLAQAGTRAGEEQRQVQTGALGGLQEGMALRGAPGGGQAQQALADMVSQQAARRAAESQATQGYAASQGAAWSGLQEGMRTTGAMSAQAARQGAARDIASRIAETRLQAGQDIREALGKKADVKALRGATMLEKLVGLRESERDYSLGRAATNLDRRAQAETARHNRASEATAAKNAQTAAQNAKDEDEAAKGGRTPEEKQDRRQEVRQIKTLLDQAIKNEPPPDNPKRYAAWKRQLENYLLHQEGIGNAALVHRIVNRMLKGGGGGGGPTPGGGAHPS
jgi:hypothetical protein